MRDPLRPSVLRLFTALALVLLPMAIFYTILVHWSFNLPILDDYHALLHPVDALQTIAGVKGKLTYLLGAQHSEYKLWLDTTVAWLQMQVMGRLNFRELGLLGDTFALGIGFVIWWLFPLTERDIAKRLVWFAPASWMLFQLSYAETLNWSMAALQNLPVVLFSLLTLMLLMRTGWGWFTSAAICLVLAVAASGNGLLVVPIGMLALVLHRQYARLAAWFTVSAMLVWGYAYHFNIMSSQTTEHRSILVTLRHFSPVYTLAVLGGVGGKHVCVALGLVLCAMQTYLWWTGYFRRHPALGYCTLFVVLTAVGVGGIRSELGLEQAISSRYQLYPVLLLIFAWFACAEKLTEQRRPKMAHRMLAAALAVTILFALKKDWWGYKFLRERKSYAQNGMDAYQQSMKQAGTLGPVYWRPEPNPYFAKINPDARATLKEAGALGTYAVPGAVERRSF